MTEITDVDYEAIKKNEDFKKHVNGGYILIRQDKVDPEVAVADGMAQRDDSAPYTPETLKVAGVKPMEKDKVA